MKPETQPREPLACCNGLDEEVLSRYCKALAHPVRVRILSILLTRGACICGDLVDQLPLAQSTISQHLKVLLEAGLIVGEIDGPRRCYCVNREAVDRLHGMIDQVHQLTR